MNNTAKICAWIASAIFAGVLFSWGCDQNRLRIANDTQNPTPPKDFVPISEKGKKPSARFVPITWGPANLTGVPWSGAFALDTKTGQLCKTYSWEILGRKQDDLLNSLPECLSLYQQYP